MDASQIIPIIEQLKVGLATTQDKLSLLSGVNISLGELSDVVKVLNQFFQAEEAKSGKKSVVRRGSKAAPRKVVSNNKKRSK